MNIILQEDFSAVYGQLQERLQDFRNKSFLVTGANGMIASYLISFLTYLNHHQQQGFPVKEFLAYRISSRCPSFATGGGVW